MPETVAKLGQPAFVEVNLASKEWDESMIRDIFWLIFGIALNAHAARNPEDELADAPAQIQS